MDQGLDLIHWPPHYLYLFILHGQVVRLRPVELRSATYHYGDLHCIPEYKKYDSKRIMERRVAFNQHDLLFDIFHHLVYDVDSVGHAS